jgi:hypothetical protein
MQLPKKEYQMFCYRLKSFLFRFRWYRQYLTQRGLRRLAVQAPDADVQTQRALARYIRKHA